MTAKKKTPERMCLGCQTVRPKKELVRIVRGPDGVFSLDLTGKKPGRGAYLCPSAACFDTAVKRHRFEKSFQQPVPPEVLERLRAEFEAAGL